MATELTATSGNPGIPMAVTAEPSVPDLVGLLQRQALIRPDETAFVFLADGSVEASKVTFGELERAVQRVARHLQARYATGERALILESVGLHYVVALFACFYAGLIAVPVLPPARQSKRLADIVCDVQPVVIMSNQSCKRRLAGLIAECWPEAHWLTPDDLGEQESLPSHRQQRSANDLALIQYTAGSTGKPKGVMLTHGNLLANLGAMRSAFDLSADTVAVSWLPPYHDLGLVGFILAPLFVGAKAVLLSHRDFYADPINWLRAISRYRATFSGAPAFAYDLCVRRITPRHGESLDLGNWRQALIGAEPIHADTLSRFVEAFSKWGFARAAFAPVYGLAEATSFVSGSSGRYMEPFQPGGHLDSSAPAGAVSPAAVSPTVANQTVACGAPIDELSVVVVDPDRRQILPAGVAGEIWVSGASVAPGYWQNPELSAQVFGLRLHDDARTFMRTGDLGYLRAGELWIIGRRADQIVVQGSRYRPQELETPLTSRFNELISCAAFAVPQQQSSGIVVVAEVNPDLHSSAELAVIREDCVQMLLARVDIPNIEVLLTGMGAIPRTTNGKLSRVACQKAYAEGALHSALGEQPKLVGRRRALAPAEAETLAWPVRVQYMAASLALRLCRLLRAAPSVIATDVPLPCLGVTSLQAITLRDEISERWRVNLPLRLFMTECTLTDLAKALLSALQLEGQHAGTGELRRFRIAERLESDDEEKAAQHDVDRYYWRSVLAPLIRPLQWMPDTTIRSATNLRDGSVPPSTPIRRLITADLAERLRDLSQQQNCTLFSALLAIYQVLLFRHAQQPDDMLVSIAVNVDREPTSARNLLPIRTRPHSSKPFSTYVREVRESVIGALAHRALPFNEIVGCASATVTNEALTQALFEMRGSGNESNVPRGAWHEPPRPHELELSISVQADDGLVCDFAYSATLFSSANVERLADRYLQLLVDTVMHPARSLGDLVLLSKLERAQILRLWNMTEIDFSAAPDLLAVLAQQALDSPSAAAVVQGRQVLRYSDLDARAQRLANHLQSFGVGSEDRVAICAQYSFELIIAIIGVLRSGATVVVLDPDQSETHLQRLLEHAAPVCVLAQAQYQLGLSTPDVPALHIDAELSHWREKARSRQTPVILQESLVCLDYRVDAAAAPLAIGVTHRALRNQVFGMQTTYRLATTDAYYVQAHYTGARLLVEILWPLLAGARLILPIDTIVNNTTDVVDIIEQYEVTVSCFEPTAVEILLANDNPKRCATLRKVFCKNAVLSLAVRQRFQQLFHAELHTLFGVGAETLDVLSHHDAETIATDTPLGSAGPNNSIFIFDEGLEPVPVGRVGELYIGGEQLARGYEQRPDLSAATFIPHPYAQTPGARLYRSGFLGYFNAEGKVEFCGRKPVRPNRLQTAGIGSERNHWDEYLTNRVASNPTLIETSRQTDVPGRVAQQRLNLNIDDSASLAAFAAREGTSLEVLVLLGWAMLLSRYTGQLDVLFGVSGLNHANRNGTGTHHDARIHAYPVPVRMRVRPQQTWQLHLQELVAAVAHVAKQPESALASYWEQQSNGPWSQLVLLQPIVPDETESDVPTVYDTLGPSGLLLRVATTPWLEFSLFSNTGWFRPEHLEQVLGQLRHVLLSLIQQPATALGNLTLGMVEVKESEPADEGLEYLHWIDHHAHMLPDKAALRQAGESLTFAALQRRVDLVANRLRARRIGPGMTIAVLDDRSLDQAVMILAVMRVGAVLLILDSQQSPDTWSLALKSAAAAWVLATPRWNHRLGRIPNASWQVLYVADLEREAGDTHQQPSGARVDGQTAQARIAAGEVLLISHSALCRSLNTWVAYLALRDTDIVGISLPSDSPAFLEQLLSALVAGATIEFLPSVGEHHAHEYQQALRARRVTVACCASTEARSLGSGAGSELAGLRCVVAEGNVAESTEMSDRSRRWAEVNYVGHAAYAGPLAVQRRESHTRAGGVGGYTLVRGADVVILDGLCDPVPLSTRGWIAIGGSGLALCYAGAPGATANAFVPHPLQGAGNRILLTDLRGSLTADGRIEL